MLRRDEPLGLGLGLGLGERYGKNFPCTHISYKKQLNVFGTNSIG